MILPASSCPNGQLRWPGVVMMMAPHLMKTTSLDAGRLFLADRLASLSLSLEVTRAQFSQMLPGIETRRMKVVAQMAYQPEPKSKAPRSQISHLAGCH